jgi:hypothetical protein
LRSSLPPVHVNNSTVITIHSIDVFEKTTGRSDNDKNNTTREYIIEYVVNDIIPMSYYKFSQRWMKFKTSLYNFIHTLDVDIRGKVQCIRKAGRKFNYDFELMFDSSTSRKIEFKFNCSKITSCPQFLSLSCKSLGKYAEYVYDMGVIQELSLTYGLTTIDRATYFKHVYQTSYAKTPWFMGMYAHEDLHKAWKKDRVDQTINDFLATFIDEMDLPLVERKMKQSQADKVFMCYHPKTKSFTKDHISQDELTIIGKSLKHTPTTRHCNTIVLDTKCPTTKIHMLLRWRNHAGILNPAWQISIHREPTSLTVCR